MKSLFSPIMDTNSGANNPTNSSFVVKNHFLLICNLEKYDFSNREMALILGQGILCCTGSYIFLDNCASSVLTFLGF